MLFTSALLFGGYVGGIGSVMSDIIAEYAFYALYTLVIESLERFLAGSIRDHTTRFRWPRGLRNRIPKFLI